jgi:hypothetical protein
VPRKAVLPFLPHRRQGTAVTALTRTILWARAAGRCQYAGCNKPLIGDLISGAEDANFGFVAHIVAEPPTGPRGDPLRSPLLANDVNNLMLMCHVHHKLIDVDEVAEHPEGRLLAMKAAHERRIEIVTTITDDRASHVLRYAANIGEHTSPVTYDQIATAMLPSRYPADGRHTIDIELRGSAHSDQEAAYWTIQRENLSRQFKSKVHDRLDAGEIRHLSVFALAPQPLLIELGRHLCDITAINVYQLHREPKGWGWPTNGPPMRLRMRKPPHSDGAPALVLALSATLADERIKAVLGQNASLWVIEAEQPHNDIMKRPADLAEFRRLLRSIFDAIKATHGEHAVINVFPAVPVSAAVEVGRVWMPKADLPLMVYDQNRSLGGFVKALEVHSARVSNP